MRSLLALAFVFCALALLTGAPLRPATRAAEAPPRATGAWKAFEWRRLAWMDENGDIPPRAVASAIDQRHAMLRAQVDRADPEPKPFGNQDWTSVGPTNTAGRTRSLLIDPANTDILLAGAVSGGLWRSTDRGANWSPVNDFLPNLAICCLERDPSDADVIYAGTGEGFFNGDAIMGDGIFKSVDRGGAWTHLPSTAGWDSVNRISVSPDDPDIILAATRYGGLMRTTDGGANWTSVRWAQASFDVDFHPTDGDLAIAHIMDFGGAPADWFHSAVYSTDAGASWTDASGLNAIVGFSSRIEVAHAPSDPTIVYASCGADGGKIWKSTDGGQSYAQVTTSGASGASWYYNPIWIDPTDPDFILTGGAYVYKSTDGGETLTELAAGYIHTETPHPDIHNFFNDPGFNGSTNRRVYVVTDGGVYRAENIAIATDHSGWERLDSTKVSTQFYGAAGDGPTGRIVGGTQDNGTLMVTPDQTDATLTFGGDGGFCAVDPDYPTYLYGEYIELSLFRSTNGGLSGQWIYNNLADSFNAANFIAPFILDPNASGTMLAGGASLWRSTNIRSLFPHSITWSAIKPAISSYISAITVAEGDSDIIWVGHNDGRVYRTDDGTAATPTWIPVDRNPIIGNPIPNRYVTRIVIDRVDPTTVYVALGGFDPQNIWRTTNNGADWAPLPGALPAAPVRGLTQHPLDTDWLYAGTEVGIFATTDAGATWSATNIGPASVSVDELSFLNNSTTLLAATHGRGMWIVETATAPAPICPGDVNDDGQTDVFDFSELAANFGAGPDATRAQGDLDDDGLVNIFDFAILAADFGCAP